MKTASRSPVSPFAQHKGELDLGLSAVDCYVLDTGVRIISLRSSVKAIANLDNGTLGDYVAVTALKSLPDRDLILVETIEFDIPGTAVKENGIPAQRFLEICQAYESAFSDGCLETDRQKEMAVRCGILLVSCAKTGLMALIDEATGRNVRQ